MDEQLTKALLAEYVQLSSSFDRHATVGYNVAPLALTALSGILVFGSSIGRFAGLGASMLVFVAAVWMGIGHTLLNRIELRLVEIELKLSADCGVPIGEGPYFFTSYIGQGAPGLTVYVSLLVLVAVIVLCVSMHQWWSVLGDAGVRTSYRVMAVAVPIALNVAAAATFGVVEAAVETRRSDLLARFEGRPASSGHS